MKNKNINLRISISFIYIVMFLMMISCTAKNKEFTETSENSTSENQTLDHMTESETRDIPESNHTDNTAEEPVQLGKGICIGNALESPKGMSWGVEMKAEYFDAIKDAGFDTVRMPVRFSDYLDSETYILEEGFMEEVDYYIQYALSKNLNLILDLHHFEKLMYQPASEKEKLIRIWEQISLRYKDYPNELIFEILNEPKEELGGELLNIYIKELIEVIRKTNPDRLIIVGGDHYNSISGLEKLSLPEDDNIVVTFHYYDPNEFAFQGNIYHEGFEHLNSITWTATDEEMKNLRDDFLRVKNWADEKNVEVFLGEFGIVKTVPVEYRGAWIKAVKEMAEEMGFSWCYWELGSHFGIYDIETSKWDTDVLQALID